jgi:hypothetical protein
MKKLVALLLSIWIPLYLLFALLASCTKTSLRDQPVTNEATPSALSAPKSNAVIGSWLLKEYYQDNGNGSGQWITAQQKENINFYADGTFLANSSDPVFSGKNYDRYAIVDSVHIDLSSTKRNDKATFYFQRESETTLNFHPLCRENCSRRYLLME